MVDRRWLTITSVFIFMIIQIFRKFPQLKCIKLQFYEHLFVQKLRGLFQPTTNILDVKLTWTGGAPTKEVFPLFTRWPHLRRLQLMLYRPNIPVNVQAKEIRDFILETKNLTHLHINDWFDHVRLESLENTVKDMVEPHRPGFFVKLGCLEVP
jgi:hypothetical protein